MAPHATLPLISHAAQPNTVPSPTPSRAPMTSMMRCMSSADGAAATTTRASPIDDGLDGTRLGTAAGGA
jgi:hypothetical protein